jgi:hypothetical protein
VPSSSAFFHCCLSAGLAAAFAVFSAAGHQDLKVATFRPAAATLFRIFQVSHLCQLAACAHTACFFVYALVLLLFDAFLGF